MASERCSVGHASDGDRGREGKIGGGIAGGKGGPAYSTVTAVLYLYQTAIFDSRWGYAAAIGMVLFAIIFFFTLVQRLLFGRAEIGY